MICNFNPNTQETSYLFVTFPAIYKIRTPLQHLVNYVDSSHDILDHAMIILVTFGGNKQFCGKPFLRNEGVHLLNESRRKL